MVHSVELLFDLDTESAIRGIWDTLRDNGIAAQPVAARPHTTLAVADQVDDGIRHLAHAPEVLDLAVEDGFGADGQLLPAPALVEEGDLEPARLVGDVAGDHGATALDPPRRDRPPDP